MEELASWSAEDEEMELTEARERRREVCVLAVLVREILLASLQEAELQETRPLQVLLGWIQSLASMAGSCFSVQETHSSYSSSLDPQLTWAYSLVTAAQKC